MHITKHIIYSISVCMLLSACRDSDIPESDDWCADGIYIAVDMAEAESRVAYHIEDNFFNGGNLAARWEIGDIIKVYEAVQDAGIQTDWYSSYHDYEYMWEYPAAPNKDKYYRFECVGGAGTPHGIFKYIGVANVVVEGGSDETYNVKIDMTYNQKINNWDNFDGVVIYGNPLRNYMMRHQDKNDDWTHIKYGQRMRGHLCNYNFTNWSNYTSTTTTDNYGYTDGFVLYNTASCIFKIVMDGFEDDIYGGATLKLEIPGVTDGVGHVHANPDTDKYPCYRKYPMSLTLGNKFDHQELKDPWCYKQSDTDTSHPKSITAYVVGWPGTVAANKEIKVTLEDRFYGKSYTWSLTKGESLDFEEGFYYTFMLTQANGYTPAVDSDESLRTSP